MEVSSKVTSCARRTLGRRRPRAIRDSNFGDTGPILENGPRPRRRPPIPVRLNGEALQRTTMSTERAYTCPTTSSLTMFIADRRVFRAVNSLSGIACLLRPSSSPAPLPPSTSLHAAASYLASSLHLTWTRKSRPGLFLTRRWTRLLQSRYFHTYVH